MENDKSKKILGIASIMWGILLLIYQILRNTVLSDWYSNTYLKQVLTNETENAQAFKLGFETINGFINIAFLIALIVIVVFLIIYYKKRNIKIFSKETSIGFYFICLGLLLCILLGINLISLIFVVIGGFLIYKKQ